MRVFNRLVYTSDKCGPKNKQDIWLDSDNFVKVFINGKWEEIKSLATSIDTSVKIVKYQDLVDLKNTSGLIPFAKYKIIDYETIVTNKLPIKSANHRFNIIVTAINSTTLDSDAFVEKCEGDEYFGNSLLSQWKIKYDINNNTNKYSWASTSGKGVIYYMKDEFGNEACYDFKNILYKCCLILDVNSSKTEDYYKSLCGQINGVSRHLPISECFDTTYWDTNKSIYSSGKAFLNTYCYTFSDIKQVTTDSYKGPFYFPENGIDSFSDMSLTKNCYNNVLKVIKDDGKMILPNITFFSNFIHDNFIEGSSNIIFYGNASCNKIGYNNSNLYFINSNNNRILDNCNHIYLFSSNHNMIFSSNNDVLSASQNYNKYFEGNNYYKATKSITIILDNKDIDLSKLTQ